MTTKPAQDGQILPSKEQNVFKKIVRCCEQKQYKLGLKLCKQILGNPKCAEHGETLAMKGLIFNCMGKKSQAYELVKLGLRKNLRSHVCWHVYGLIQRSDRKYDEAIKAYRNALKWDKDNLQILRDLSLLQIQMRDLEGFKDTRFQLLAIRPTLKVNWIAYAIAHHLMMEYEVAIKILDEFKKFEQNSPTDLEYETSELLLYQNTIMREAGQVKEALEHLESNSKNIFDRLSFIQTKAELFNELGERESSAQLYLQLIERNPQCWQYYRALEGVLGLKDEATRLALYQRLHTKFPRADPPLRLPLGFATGNNFRSLADAYLRKALHKGLPSLFMNFKHLYNDAEKVLTLQDLATGYLTSLETHLKFIPTDDEEEPPTSTLWTLLYLAQHFDRLGEHTHALGYIDRACEHTPTLLECLVIKAKIYKHMGNFELSNQVMEECQALDTADRFINCKAARCLLLCNRIEDAAQMCSKFTREGTSAVENLTEMQCMWFLVESAAAYQRLGMHGEALKKCHEVKRHFDDILDDQFDFHTYCMRKMTLRSYTRLLRLEDTLQQHRFYFCAARIAISEYLYLHDNPVTDKQTEIDIASMTPQEVRKLKKRREKERKREEERLKQEEEERQRRLNQQRRDEGDVDGPNLADLLPHKLERPDNALSEALVFLLPLQKFSKDLLDTHLLAFQVHHRRHKLMPMLQSLLRARRLSSSSPRVHVATIQFGQELLQQRSVGLHPTVETVLGSTELAFLLDPETQLPTLNQHMMAENPNSISHLFAGTEVSILLEPQRRNEIFEDFIQSVGQIMGSTIKDCQDVFSPLALGTYPFGDLEPALVESLGNALTRLHPSATCFTLFTPSPPDVTKQAAATLLNGIHEEEDGMEN